MDERDYKALNKNSKTKNKFPSVCLDYFCPGCDQDFKSEVWKIVDCPRCGLKIETDYTDDEYAGIIGVCNFVDTKLLPLPFIIWYSGMTEEKILKAFERWKIENK